MYVTYDECIVDYNYCWCYWLCLFLEAFVFNSKWFALSLIRTDRRPTRTHILNKRKKWTNKQKIFWNRFYYYLTDICVALISNINNIIGGWWHSFDETITFRNMKSFWCCACSKSTNFWQPNDLRLNKQMTRILMNFINASGKHQTCKHFASFAHSFVIATDSFCSNGRTTLIWECSCSNLCVWKRFKMFNAIHEFSEKKIGKKEKFFENPTLNFMKFREAIKCELKRIFNEFQCIFKYSNVVVSITS